MPRKSKTQMETLVTDIENGEAYEGGEPEVKKTKATKKKKAAPVVDEPDYVDLGPPAVDSNRVDEMRVELATASDTGEVTHTSEQIKKASAKTIERLHAKMSAVRKKRNGELATEIVIEKFAEVLCILDLIRNGKDLATELRDNKMLKADVEKAVAMVIPYVPFIGVISGSTTVAKHIYYHKCSKAIEEVITATTANNLGDQRGTLGETAPGSPVEPANFEDILREFT